MAQMDPPNGGNDNKLVLLVALLTVLIVGGVLLGGILLLSRSGTLDELISGVAPLPTPSPAVTPSPGASVGAPEQPTNAAPMPTQAATAGGLPQATLDPTLVPTITPAASPTPTLMPTPSLEGRYVVEYLGCQEHGSDVGTVKGQVFDRQGHIVVGAEVRVTLDGYAYDTVGCTNQDGWYEFYLDRGLKVQIVSLRINGQDVPLVGAEQAFQSRGGCFEHVNLRQH